MGIKHGQHQRSALQPANDKELKGNFRVSRAILSSRANDWRMAYGPLWRVDVNPTDVISYLI